MCVCCLDFIQLHSTQVRAIQMAGQRTQQVAQLVRGSLWELEDGVGLAHTWPSHGPEPLGFFAPGDATGVLWLRTAVPFLCTTAN